MKDIGVGDIVLLDSGEDGMFHIIISSADDGYYVQTIFPVEGNPPVFKTDNAIEILAELGSYEYEALVKRVNSDRKSSGYRQFSLALEIKKWRSQTKKVEDSETLSNESYDDSLVDLFEEVKIKEPIILSSKDFNKLLRNSKVVNRIEKLKEDLDKNLELLHEAMVESNSKKIENRKRKLTEIHQELMSLEYFDLGERKRR